MTDHDIRACGQIAALQGLIFDVDGTLTENEELHRQAFNEAFRHFELDWYWDRERYADLLHTAGGRERIQRFLRSLPEAPSGWRDPQQRIAALHAWKSRCYADAVRAGTLQLRPGVARLIHEARAAGMRLAIATTTSKDNVLALLESTLDPTAHGWFDCIASGETVRHKKPAPDLYLRALRGLGLDARRCLALEDSRIGLQASLSAGIATVITVNHYTRDQDFSGAVSVLSDLGEAEQPAQHLDGLAPRGPCVDLAQLQAWFQQWQSASIT